jgi:predicted hydrocarbon binding protein
VSPDIAIPAISNRMVQLFAEAAVHEVGIDKIPSILAMLSINDDEIEKDAIARLKPTEAASLYASMQEALRLFYGRGARGILLRLGRSMWDRMTTQASFREKAELEIARRLPVPARRRRVLELVADRLREGGGATSTHTLDMDLLLVDASGAATVNQTFREPICSVTMGMIQEALFWATGQEVDVDEISCKAAGAPTCEFKILLGSR